MDFMRMRSTETELSLEQTPAGLVCVVRRYRPRVLVREAVRGLGGGLVSVAVLTGFAGVLGSEWAIVVCVTAMCGWAFVAVMLGRIVLRGGPVSKVADLPSRWIRVPADAKAEAFRWALLEEQLKEEDAGEVVPVLQRRAESEVDRTIAEMLVGSASD